MAAICFGHNVLNEDAPMITIASIFFDIFMDDTRHFTDSHDFYNPC